MADLEDLIRQVNRDMEEHRRQAEYRWQVEASPPPRAIGEAGVFLQSSPGSRNAEIVIRIA
jgi:hypothetical protein